jgi:hypothetical protein
VLAPLTSYYGKPSIRDVLVETLWGDPPPYVAPLPQPPQPVQSSTSPPLSAADVSPPSSSTTLDNPMVILVIVLSGIVGGTCMVSHPVTRPSHVLTAPPRCEVIEPCRATRRATSSHPASTQLTHRGAWSVLWVRIQVTVVLFIFSMRKAAEAKKRLKKRSQRRKERLPKKDDQLSALEKVSQWDDTVLIQAENPAFSVQVSHPVSLTIPQRRMGLRLSGAPFTVALSEAEHQPTTFP